MDRMLDHARTIAEREEMPHPHFRYDRAFAPGNDRIDRRCNSAADIFACDFENRKITLGCLHPSHRSARRVCALAHCLTTYVVCQKSGDFGAQGFGIAKMDQNAVAVTSQFLGVPIMPADLCLSQSKAVGECT